MSKMKNYMMDIEEFCDGYAVGGDEQCIDEVVAAADNAFRSTMAGDYARDYLTQKFGNEQIGTRFFTDRSNVVSCQFV